MNRPGRDALHAGTPARLIMVGLAFGLLAAGCGPAPAPSPSPVQNPLSLGASNTLGDGPTSGASISADGNWVAFVSRADNLVPGPATGTQDLYLRNRTSGSVIRVREDVLTQVRVSIDGRYVSYRTGGSTVGVYDRLEASSDEWTTTLSSPTTPVVPLDGSVAIYGNFSSLGVFQTSCRVRDLQSGIESDCPPNGPGFGALSFEAVSGNGRFVLYFWNDQSGGGTSARLLWDRDAGTTTEIAVPILTFGNSTYLSDDGRFVAALDFAEPSGLTPVLHDLQTATVTPFPVATTSGWIVPIDVSADGRYVLLVSESDELVAEDSNGAYDVFRWDTVTGDLERISETIADGQQLPNGALNCNNGPGQLLADGSAGCVRTSDPLVALDTNGLADAYLVG